MGRLNLRKLDKMEYTGDILKNLDNRDSNSSSFDSFQNIISRRLPNSPSRIQRNDNVSLCSTQRLSRILPIYYLIVSFIFLGCLLHQSYTLSQHTATMLPSSYKVCVLTCIVYLVLLLFVSMRRMCLVLQRENKDIIATTLVFILM